MKAYEQLALDENLNVTKNKPIKVTVKYTNNFSRIGWYYPSGNAKDRRKIRRCVARNNNVLVSSRF